MDESQKQRVLLAIIAFNLTVLAFQLIFNMGLFGFPFTWGKLMIAMFLGVVVAGATFAAANFLQR